MTAGAWISAGYICYLQSGSWQRWKTVTRVKPGRQVKPLTR